jgi:hypothetical protein
MASAPASSPESALSSAVQRTAEVGSLDTDNAGRHPEVEGPPPAPLVVPLRRSRLVEATLPSEQVSSELHLPTLGAVARVVAPTLGGALLGGLFVPAWVVGWVAGGALGLLVGLARDREVTNSAR